MGGDTVQQRFVGQRLADRINDVRNVLARQPTKVRFETTFRIQRIEDWQRVDLPQLKILGPAAGGDVDNPRALGIAHVIPADDAMG